MLMQEVTVTSDAQKHLDIIEWDVANWRKAAIYRDRKITEPFAGGKALEIGGQNGGLSLYLALKGCKVVCSDYQEPTPRARKLMMHYGVSDLVNYANVDVTDIAHLDNTFNIVAFKSVLGSVGIHKGAKGQQRAVNKIYRVLKPNGLLLFAENLNASAAHTFFRKRFVAWGKAWRYLTVQEMKRLASQFSAFQYETYGYFACFGRSERQKQALSILDRMADPLLSEHHKYIIYGYAKK